MTGQDCKALGTSFARSWTLFVEGYKFRRLDGPIVQVQGKPTTHKRRGTGETYINPHGPYTVDTRKGSQTCTCEAFANRGACCHLPAAIRWLDSLESGESVDIYTIERSKDYIAFQEIEGSRYLADSERRVVVFRDWTAAASFWQQNELTGLCIPEELRSIELEELAAKGKYAGLVLQTPDGSRQPIPLPEVDWSARATRGRAAKREDFD